MLLTGAYNLMSPSQKSPPSHFLLHKPLFNDSHNTFLTYGIAVMENVKEKRIITMNGWIDVSNALNTA